MYLTEIMRAQARALLSEHPGSIEYLRNLAEKSDTSPLVRQTLLSGLDAIEGDRPVMSEAGDAGIKAVIFNVQRPALFFDGPTFTPAPPPWTSIVEPVRVNLNGAASAVAVVFVAGLTPPPAAATGFLVRPGVLLTNRHVLQGFMRGPVNNRQLIPGAQPFVDFAQHRSGAAPRRFPITGLLAEHPVYDAALVHVGDGNGPLPQPLTFATSALTSARNIAAIGHPLQPDATAPPAAHAVFPPPFAVKRLSPGRAQPGNIGSISMIFHDASTEAGNSGSPILDLSTGEVLGLHFRGRLHERNEAVPLSEIAQMIASA